MISASYDDLTQAGRHKSSFETKLRDFTEGSETAEFLNTVVFWGWYALCISSIPERPLMPGCCSCVVSLLMASSIWTALRRRPGGVSCRPASSETPYSR